MIEVHVTPATSSPFLTKLRADLREVIDREVEMTVQVAICMTAGMTRNQMMKALYAASMIYTPAMVKVAEARVQEVAKQWREAHRRGD